MMENGKFLAGAGRLHLYLSTEEVEDEEGDGKLSYEMGRAPLINLRASKLERDLDYYDKLCGATVCKFRGMECLKMISRRRRFGSCRCC